MRRSEGEVAAPGRADWLGWVALGWAIVAALLYARMVVESRLPGLGAAIRRLVS